MSVTYINGIPVANVRRMGYIESYFTPQKPHLRDIAEAQDVEYEEIYEQENNQDDENNPRLVD